MWLRTGHKTGQVIFSGDKPVTDNPGFFRASLSARKKQHLYTQLSVLSGAGLDLRTSLELMVSEEKNRTVKLLLNRILEQVIGGHGLAASLGQEKVFSTYELQSIRIGEETARITEIFTELAGYFERSVKFRRHIINALSYPAVMFSCSVAVMIFMLSFVVPMLEDVLNRFGGELPLLTRIVVALSDYLSVNGIYLLILAGCAAGVFFYARKQVMFRKMCAHVLMQMPVAGPFTRKIYCGRFCQVMYLLLSSHTQLVEAIRLTKGMIGFLPFEQALGQVEKRILEGSSLYHALLDQRIFDPRLTALVRVAEEVNQLESIFGKLGQQYAEEIEHKSGVLKQVMEPVVILFIGAVIGTILIAMYLPLFELSNTINTY